MAAKRTGVDPLEPERHQRARVEMSSNHSRDRGSAMNVTTYGLDLAKRVFQVHWVELDTGEVKRKALARGDVSAFFAVRAPGLIAMEACGSAHHWGRMLKGFGHEVRLIAAQFVGCCIEPGGPDLVGQRLEAIKGDGVGWNETLRKLLAGQRRG